MRDFCVIGGGIVGLSVAKQLLEKFPGSDVLLLEKESKLAAHQTGRNSGVIHSGIYYAPGSLKAKLCKQGAADMYSFCEEYKIPVENCGKLLVATSDQEVSRLEQLAKRAVEHKIEFEDIDQAELSVREPNISGLRALYVPSTGIVDYNKVCTAMANVITKNGGEIKLQTEVTRIEEKADCVEISDQSIRHRSKQLVVCTGVQSDRMIGRSGMEPKFRIVPFRGEYYRLDPKLNSLIKSLIYPIPDPDLPFLGIHLTRMIDGGITVGPNAVLGLAREKYARFSCDFHDVKDFLSYPGFWRVIARNFRSGISEFSNSAFKSKYLKACQKYCPSLTSANLMPADTGIRAQAVLRDGSFVQDFLFHETKRTLHVCNAPSPAATSSLPIGAMIVDKIELQQSNF